MRLDAAEPEHATCVAVTFHSLRARSVRSIIGAPESDTVRRSDMVAPVQLRIATPDDARAIAAIYAPVVVDTAISFELEPPTETGMHWRLIGTLRWFPWLVSLDDAGLVSGYAYVGAHRERPAYQWSVDTTVYARAASRGQCVGRGQHEGLLVGLTKLGYAQAFAGMSLPNAASVALHEAIGFKLGGWRDVG